MSNFRVRDRGLIWAEGLPRRILLVLLVVLVIDPRYLREYDYDYENENDLGTQR